MDTNIETFLEAHILPNFLRKSNELHWQGHGDLDSDSEVHYFSADNQEYILIFEDTPRLSKSWVEENTVPTYQSLKQITPLRSSENPRYVFFYMDSNPGKYISGQTGCFSLFYIVK